MHGCSGDVIEVPLAFQNQATSPIESTCYIGLLDRNSKMTEVIVGDMPINKDVASMETFEIVVPLYL